MCSIFPSLVQCFFFRAFQPYLSSVRAGHIVPRRRLCTVLYLEFSEGGQFKSGSDRLHVIPKSVEKACYECRRRLCT
jgi:hypothetical protein